MPPIRRSGTYARSKEAAERLAASLGVEVEGSTNADVVIASILDALREQIDVLRARIESLEMNVQYHEDWHTRTGK